MPLYNCILNSKKFTGIILIKIFIKKNTRNILKSAEIIAEKASIFLHMSELVVRTAYAGVSNGLSLSVRTVKLSDFDRVLQGRRNLSAIVNYLNLSVRTVKSVSLCQFFSVMSVQHRSLFEFVSEK